jgi:hypothetical protein
LAAAYAGTHGAARKPFTDDTATIDPPPASRCGSAARAV